MSVSNSNENAMLNTVRVLRRLLRNAFLVTNRVNVIGELQREPGTGGRRQARPSATRIDELPCHRQPGQIRLLPCLSLRNYSLSLLSLDVLGRKWRSSLGRDDNCHPQR